jgi:hypothetical protein
MGKPNSDDWRKSLALLSSLCYLAMSRAELQQLNGRLGDLVAAGEEGVHGEVGEPVEVLQAGVDPNLGGEVRVRELVHCPPTTKHPIIGAIMDQISIKTPNPKSCRLF